MRLSITFSEKGSQWWSEQNSEAIAKRSRDHCDAIVLQFLWRMEVVRVATATRLRRDFAAVTQHTSLRRTLAMIAKRMEIGSVATANRLGNDH
jgi:hypothetical protein